jgi:hypothetical protein
MRHAAPLLLVALFCPAATSAQPVEPLVIYAFDQTLDAILRIEDINGDGDTLDEGEVIRFFDDTVPITGTENSQGLLALGLDTLLATDNLGTDNVVYLRDLNGDGDAFDADENRVWFDGALPNGFDLTNPVNLSWGPGPAIYMIDNNTLDTANPESVYRMSDDNADGDVNDPGEVSEYFRLSPTGIIGTTTFDIEFDASGAGYVLDITDPNQIESIDRIEPGGDAISEWIDSVDLLNLAGLVFAGMNELSYLPDTDEIVAGAASLSSATYLIALKDDNGNGRIDLAGEIRVLWSEPGHADGISTGYARDILVTPGNSIVWPDALNDRIMRLVDLNGDGDYNDLGETIIVYDADTAGPNGQEEARNLLSAAAYPAGPDCLGDLDGDGDTDQADLGVLLASYGVDAGGDLDGDGDTDQADLGVLLGDWGCGG